MAGPGLSFDQRFFRLVSVSFVTVAGICCHVQAAQWEECSNAARDDEVSSWCYDAYCNEHCDACSASLTLVSMLMSCLAKHVRGKIAVSFMSRTAASTSRL